MPTMDSSRSFSILAIAVLVLVVAGAAYFYGRDSDRGDGNDIRIDLPDKKR